MTVSIWQAEDNQPTTEVDLLIVGAGLVGCITAYFAAQALPSDARIIVTDMRDVALGASGRNAGFMITGLDAYYHHAIERYGHDTVRDIYALSEKTHRIWRQFTTSGNVRFDECGSTLLAETEAEAQDIRLAYEAMRADGIEPIFYDHDPLGRGYYAALEQPWDAAVQPVELSQEILRQSSVTLIDNNELYAIRQRDDAHAEVLTRQHRFVARYVMLCTNAYSPYIHPYFEGKVIPTRAQCLITQPLEEPVLSTCGYSDYGYMYYRMTFDNRLLIGGGRKHNKAQENDTSDDRVTSAVQSTLDAYLRERFPEVTAPVARRWSGIMGFTADGLPMVGTLPDMSSVGFAVGFNGHGLALGAGIAERALDHLLNGTEVGAISAKRLTLS